MPGTSGDMYNVKAFGATGDGITNDVGAIQAAIDAANGSGGGIVFIPGGTYIIASTLVLKSNVALVGVGPASSIKAGFSRGTQSLLNNDWVNGSENCSLRNIQFDRTGANAQHGLLLSKLTNFLADGLSVVGPASVTSGAMSITRTHESTCEATFPRSTQRSWSTNCLSVHTAASGTSSMLGSPLNGGHAGK